MTHIISFCLLLVLYNTRSASAVCGLEFYKPYANMHVSGGTPQGGSLNVAACQARCSLQGTCVGVDTNLNNECWLHTDGFAARASDPGITHRRRTITCSMSGGSDCDFEYDGQFTATGSTSSQATLQACLDLCLADSNCVAAAYRSTGGTSNNCVQIPSKAALALKTPNTNFVMYDTQSCTRTAACPTYTSYPQMNAPNGVPQPNINTEQACKDNCNGNVNCYGVDFGPGGCYVHLSPDVASNRQPFTGGTNTLFIIDRFCSGPTTPATGCTGRFTVTNNTHALGGTPRSDLTTEAACRQACVADNNCVGFDNDYTPGGTLCWLHLNAGNLQRTEGQQNTFLYTLQERCPGQCVPRWTLRNNTSARGGERQTAITTAEACRTQCAADNGCFGYDLDFNVGATLCWWHRSESNLADTVSANNIFSYQLVDRCPTGGVTTAGTTAGTTTSGCNPRFTITNNTHAINGDPRSDLTTRQACEDACAANASCIAYDADFTGGILCWFHVNAADLSNTRSRNNVYLYTLVDRCPGQCNPRYTVQNNTQAVGGAEQPTISTAAECAQKCGEDNSCVGYDVDFNTGNTLCWFHRSLSNLDNTRSATNVYSYKLQDRCPVGTASTTVSTSGTTTQACNPRFTITNNTHALNGEERRDLATQAACQSACAADTSCVAYDADFNPGRTLCWLHRNPANLNTVVPENGVYLYTLQDRCPGQCNPTWTIRNDTSANGGVQQSNIRNADDCLMQCAADNGCFGADLDFNTNAPTLCWWHMSNSNFDASKLTSATNIYSYQVLERCPGTGTTTAQTGTTTPGCVPRWTIQNNTHARDGTPQTALTTVDACQKACFDNSGCVAIDVDFSAGATLCWLHLNAANLQKTEPQNNAYFYILADRCPGQCTPRWRVTNNTHAFNGVPYTAATTAQQCWDACVDDSDCVAVDVDFSGATLCWKHSSRDDLNDVETQNNVYLYELVDRCPVAGQTTSSTTRITTPACVPVWRMRNDTSAANGERQETITNPDDCLSRCAADDTCVGADLDFNPGSPLCWFHRSRNNFDDVVSYENAYSYELVTRCGEGTVRPECRPLWNIRNDTHAFNGVEREEVTSADECLRLCVAESNCVAVDIDYNPNSNLCWFHTDIADLSDTGPLTNSYLYELVDRCPGPTPTTTPTTTTEGGPTVCVMLEYQDANSNGGNNMGPMSEYDCWAGCFFDLNCLSADWDKTTTTCYFHNERTGRRRNTCCTRYEYQCIVAPCRDRFEVFENQEGINGVLDNRFGTLAQCQAACLFSDNCPAFDWGKGSNNCYLYSNTGLGSLRSNPNFDAYSRVSCNLPQPPTVPTPATPFPANCFADLVFVLDRSGSMSDWQRVKDFVKQIVATLPINFNNVRVAVVTFSDTATVQFDLDDNLDITRVNQAIDLISYSGGRTNTAAGLQVANAVLTPSGGARSNIQDIVILVSDGRTTLNENQLDRAASDLKNRNVAVFGVGVSGLVDFNELYRVASSDLNVFSIADFTHLMDRLDSNAFGVCRAFVPPVTTPSPITTPTPTPTRPIEQCLLDIALVVDESGSIEDDDPDNWGRIQNFLNRLVARLDLNRVKFAALTFGNDAEVKFRFSDDYNTASQYQADINGWQYRGGNTNTTGALRLARIDLLNPNNGNRPNVRDVVLIITDGNTTREVNELPNEVRMVKNLPATIVGVGVTSRIDIRQMEMIVTSPSSQNFFFVDDFEGLVADIDAILQRSCFIQPGKK